MGYPLRTSSEGMLRLRSGDPREGPVISTNFLATDHDRTVMIGLARYVRRLFLHPLVAPFIAAEACPGPDARAVLDPALRVRGVDGLCVVDLSAMPTQVSGNINGPAIAFAWRAAEVILSDRTAGRATA